MIQEWDHKRYLLDFLAIEHGNFLETAWLRYEPFLLLSYIACFHSFILEYWGQVEFYWRKGTLRSSFPFLNSSCMQVAK
ncbi:hypothetical protein LguiA_013309 [Lonicera macranthoides]